jgi:secondary thiamine-phosphate synthase enzyme
MSVRQASGGIIRRTPGRGLHEITREVAAWVAAQGMSKGLLTLFIRHTTASLLIQENADPDVLADLDTFLARIAPDDPSLYRHRTEGPDDMPSHIRAVLTETQLSVPVVNGGLLLGTWQGIYVFEHRLAPHDRHVALHLIGE